MTYRANIYNSELAVAGPFIYAIYSSEFSSLYIGQTMNANGALARLAQHLSNGWSNTYKQRLRSVFNLETVMLNTVNFTALNLSNKKSFHSKARDYREAVETLVQYSMINRTKEIPFDFTVISRVKLNPYCNLKYVQDEAKTISDKLCLWLVTCNLS